jgi:peptidyl-prolyl cis-trans isomerase C
MGLVRGAVLLAGAGLLLAPACRKDPTARFRNDRTTLAVVGRYAISAEDFEAIVKENLAAGEPQDAAKSRLWDRTVEEVLILSDAYGASQGSEIEPLARAGTVQQRREAVDLLLQREVTSKVRVTDADVADYYSRHEGEFRKGRGYLLRQITVPKRSLAEEVRGRLLRDEPFQDVARKYSVAPDLGVPVYFEDSELPDYLSNTLKGLRPGLPSPPLNVAAEAWQVVRIERRAESYTLPVETVTAQVRLKLADERGEALYRQYLQSLGTRFPTYLFPKKFPFAYQKEVP